MRTLYISILCAATVACDGSPPEHLPAPVPFQKAKDSTSLEQYIGTWQSDCVFEVIYNYPPNPTTPSVFKRIRYVISEEKAEKTIQRYSDDQCTQYTDSTRGYNFYHQSILLQDISISYDQVDAQSGLIFGMVEGSVSAIHENSAPVTHYTIPPTLDWPIYRGENTLYSGEYFYHSGGGFYRLDTEIDLHFLGDPDFFIPAP